jgi:hypothetical protein
VLGGEQGGREVAGGGDLPGYEPPSGPPPGYSA